MKFYLYLNIILITGGPSVERDVSISSSRSILKALRELGHTVRVIDPVNGEEEISEDQIFDSILTRGSPTLEKLNRLKNISKRNSLKCINSELFENVDLAFLGVHGKFGEDGKIQTLLELRGIPYTGSDVFSSALAMDKNISKIIFNSIGIKTPRWIKLDKNSHVNYFKLNKELSDYVGYPYVVKPNDEGSTVGLSIVQPDVEDVMLHKAVELAFSYSDKIIIEEYVKGKELTVTIIGNEVYPVVEIRPIGGFYDYEHKYTKGMTEYFCPAELDTKIEEQLKRDAMKAHKTIGCSVYSRIDFLLDDKNNLYCLEVNTLPGMTETSLVPKSAAAKGISFNELIAKLIKLSLEKN